LKVVRLPIPPPGQSFCVPASTARGSGHCKRYHSSCGVVGCVFASSCAGATGTAVVSCCTGTEGTAPSTGAAGTPGAALPSGTTVGATGTCDITPRSAPCEGCRRAPLLAYQAMNKVTAKNEIASHLVALERKLDEPRAPNTVAEAPPPKPEPAWAPAPRCMRIRATIETAISTKTMLRISNSM